MIMIPCGEPLAPRRLGRTRATLRPVTDRILSNCVVEPNTGCWLWIGGVDGCGYGTIRVAGRTQGAHRVAYETIREAIPDGLEIDHLCRVPCCVNPDHMEVVTGRENKRRMIPHGRTVTHCRQGHPLSGSNLFYTNNGKHRVCRTCSRKAALSYYHRRRAAS